MTSSAVDLSPWLGQVPAGLVGPGAPLAVAGYCSAAPDLPARYLDLAFELGAAIGAAGHTLVWGGGRISMMGALARGARSRGAATVGVIPWWLRTVELADEDATVLVEVPDLTVRILVMEALAGAFIAAAGGIGTAHEILGPWTAAGLGQGGRPVVLCDPWGDYAGLTAWLGSRRDAGFVAAGAVEAAVCTESTEAAVLLAQPSRTWAASGKAASQG